MPRILGVSLLLFAATLPLGAVEEPETYSLPASSTFNAGTFSKLSLHLDRAIVSITLDDEATASWKAKPAKKGGANATLSIGHQSGDLIVRREASEAPPATIRVELVVPESVELEVAGNDLELEIAAPLVDPPQNEPDATASTGADGSEDDSEPVTSGPDLESQLDGAIWRHHLHLANSTAVLSGLSGVRLEARGSDVALRGTAGALALELEEGALASEDHFGLIHLAHQGSEVDIERQVGALLFETTGGELTILTGDGPFEGTSRGGSVSFLDWSGQAVIDAQETRIAARDSREGAALELAGNGLDIDIVRHEGTLEAELTGGRARGSDLRGNVTIAARDQAEIAFEALTGEETAFDLTAGAGADLRDVDAPLEVTLDQGRLEVTGVAQLGLKGLDSDVVAADVDGVRMISLKNSRFDLDLTAISRRQPAMALRGTVDGRLELAQPCVVRMAGDVGLIEENARVTGCDLVTLASPKKERMRGQKGYPEGTMVLVTNLERGGRIEIEGVVVP